MAIQLDPRARALQNDGAAHSLLSDLHRQILARPHALVLTELLGKYVATAVARSNAAPGPVQPGDRLSKLTSTISNIMKKAHDDANAIVQNMKA
jgi:hypothetical protein